MKKRANVNMEFYVSENFVPGDCEKCVFRKVDEHEISYQVYERTVSCVLGRKPFNCPIYVCVPSNTKI